MFSEHLGVPYVKRTSNRLCQGDILRDIEISNFQGVTTLSLPYAVVLSQDCDLKQDYDCRFKTEKTEKDDEDKILTSILVCPAFPAVSLREGIHLEGYKLKRQKINSDDYKKIKSNQNKRYHYLAENMDLQVPELILDFKLYYAFPSEVLYKNHGKTYLATINNLLREDLSQRFAYYLSRIGLPEFSKKPPSE